MSLNTRRAGEFSFNPAQITSHEDFVEGDIAFRHGPLEPVFVLNKNIFTGVGLDELVQVRNGAKHRLFLAVFTLVCPNNADVCHGFLYVE